MCWHPWVPWETPSWTDKPLASTVHSVLPCSSHHSVSFEVVVRTEGNVGTAVCSLMNGLSHAKSYSAKEPSHFYAFDAALSVLFLETGLQAPPPSGFLGGVTFIKGVQREHRTGKFSTRMWLPLKVSSRLTYEELWRAGGAAELTLPEIGISWWQSVIGEHLPGKGLSWEKSLGGRGRWQVEALIHNSLIASVYWAR